MWCTKIATRWVSGKKKFLFYLLDAKMCLLTKRCLLNENVPIKRKKCLLNENMSIDRKRAYWMKMYLLNENVSIDKKCAYWMKMCMLKGHNHLGINSGSYSFGKFFSNSLSYS